MVFNISTGVTGSRNMLLLCLLHEMRVVIVSWGHSVANSLANIGEKGIGIECTIIRFRTV